MHAELARRAMLAVSILVLGAASTDRLAATELRVPGWVFFRTSPLLPDEPKYNGFGHFVIAKVKVKTSAKKIKSEAKVNTFPSKFKLNSDNNYATLKIKLLKVYDDQMISSGNYEAKVSTLDLPHRGQPPDDIVNYSDDYYYLLRKEEDGTLKILQRDLRVRNGRF